MNEPQRVTIYTDGACSGNPGPGGWAAILFFSGREREVSGGEAFTTNNRMEIRAAIEGLNALRRPCAVDLFTDSQYVRQGITQWMHNWKRRGWRTASNEPVKNEDLWRELDAAAARHEVKWHWVKGHASDPINIRVDELAVSAMQPFRRRRGDGGAAAPQSGAAPKGQAASSGRNAPPGRSSPPGRAEPSGQNAAPDRRGAPGRDRTKR